MHDPFSLDPRTFIQNMPVPEKIPKIGFSDFKYNLGLECGTIINISFWLFIGNSQTLWDLM